MSASSSPPLPPLPSSSRPAVRAAEACAACRYQRRRCTPDCILAPYFPASQPQLFESAHDLFGVNKISQIIRGLDKERRDAAMRNIIFQSVSRSQDPIYGCYKWIQQVQADISAASKILEEHRRTLQVLRSQSGVQCQTSAVVNDSIPHQPPPPPLPPPQPAENRDNHVASSSAPPSSEAILDQGLQTDIDVPGSNDDSLTMEEIYGDLTPLIVI